MLYKETGQYKSTYKSDHAIFPLIQDKIAFSTLMFIAFLIIPFVINSYWEKAILVPFLIFSLAAIGLNIFDGILWSSFFGNWWVYGSRSFFDLQNNDLFS